jgi:hypothetical protein
MCEWYRLISRAVAVRALMMRMVSVTCSVHTTTMTPRSIGPMAMNRSSALEWSSS